MAIVTSIIGKSGSGKSTSFETLEDPSKVFIIRPSKKPFPFGAKFKKWDTEKKEGSYIHTNDAELICQVMETMTTEYGKKIIIIEDSTFLMTDYFMATAGEKGYDKFTNNALQYYNVIKAAEALEDDITVYLINHLDEDATGFQKVRTIGKMLDEKVDIPSLLTIVLYSTVYEKKHLFKTNMESNFDIAKSPRGMFDELYIPNDLQLVDTTIRKYYDIEI